MLLCMALLTTKRFSDYFSNLKLFNWADGIVKWMTKTFTNNASTIGYLYLARDKNLNSLVRDSDAFVDYTDMTGLDLWSMMLAALQKIAIMPIISRPLVYSSALTDRIRWLNLKKTQHFIHDLTIIIIHTNVIFIQLHIRFIVCFSCGSVVQIEMFFQTN